jgi:hypothetical protein
MRLRGLLVLFLGLVFLLPVASLPSLAPSSSNMPIACASILPAHVKNSTLEQPALGCAAFALPPASVPLVTGAKRGAVRVIAQVKTQVKITTLSLVGSGNVGIGTTAPGSMLDIEGTQAAVNWTQVAQFDSGGGGGAGSGSVVSIQEGSTSGKYDGGRIYGGRWATPRGVRIAAVDWQGSQGIGAEYNFLQLDSLNNAFFINTNNAERLRIDTNGNVGHSDNRPGFRDVQFERFGREEVARRGDVRRLENGRRNPLIEHRQTFTPPLSGDCFTASPLTAALFFRAS